MTYERKIMIRIPGNGEGMNVILFDKAAQNTFVDIQTGYLI